MNRLRSNMFQSAPPTEVRGDQMDMAFRSRRSIRFQSAPPTEVRGDYSGR